MYDQNRNASPFDELTIALLSQGKSIRLRGNGNSMAPVFLDGSVIVIDPITSPPNRGDILLFRTAKNRLYIHRVIAIKPSNSGKSLYLMRGDANIITDGWIPEDHLIGIVNSSDVSLRPSLKLALQNILIAIRYWLREIIKK